MIIEDRDAPTQKHTLNLYEGDFDRLRELYPHVGASIVIRRLIRRYIEDIERKALQGVTVPEIPEVKGLLDD